MCIAYNAHHGQVDKAGVPYIYHPVHLAESMEDEISCCAALLHDVVEDTDITLEMLRKEFPQEVIDVLRLMTHHAEVPYFDYVRAIKDNPIAVKVKLADIAHNSDQSRITNSSISEEARTYLRTKYQKARKILEE